ncbi:hypothetical protein EJ110_NYTH32880 [Nymphaea thermarum]|nr:hypothetical protein EJ110_NYTH32880 [Nymphaea thermarum]
MEAYDKCLSRMGKYEADRRSSSLKYVSPILYSKEGRRSIPESTIKHIASLNSLDVELHKYAQKIFEQRQQRLLSSRKKASNNFFS